MFGGYFFYFWELVSVTFRVGQSHVCGLFFLHLGVSQSYVWGLVRLTFGG